MKPTTLRFFNEVAEPALARVFTPTTLRALRALGAGVTMGLLDRSPARARLIRELTDQGVPVGAWLLLPRADGYFATHDNFALIEALVTQTLDWARAEGLTFEALGFDFEPALSALEALMRTPLPTFARWSWRARDATRWQAAHTEYGRFIARIREAGARVETYQFPLVLADRAAKGSLWQRIAGGLDVASDREVTMLYSSLLGVSGPGLIERLAPRCQAIGVGSTGGGVDDFPKLTWAELERDLLLASARCSDLSLFSLEGCVEHDLLDRLRDFDWGRSAEASTTSRVWGHLLSAFTSALSVATR